MASARQLASVLFLRALTAEAAVDQRVLVRLGTVFNITLPDIEDLVRLCQNGACTEEGEGGVSGRAALTQGEAMKVDLRFLRVLLTRTSAPGVEPGEGGGACTESEGGKDAVGEVADLGGIGDADVERGMSPSASEVSRKVVQNFLMALIRRKAYTSAVALMKQLGCQLELAREALVGMVRDNQAELAAEWAGHLGRDTCRFLVRQCTEEGQFKAAYQTVQKYGLAEEFPEAYLLYRKR